MASGSVQYVCACKYGFSGDGKSGNCRVFGICPALESSKCDTNAICTPTAVSNTVEYVCSCKSGYTGDGKSGNCQVATCSVTVQSLVTGPNTVTAGECGSFACPSCYSGATTSRCCTNGVLSGSFPSCQKADCSVSKPSCVGGPTSIDCGSSATYSCECGKSGSSTTQTCSNGVLSGSFPSCRDQDCSVSRPSNVDGPNSISADGCQTFSCPSCYSGASTSRCCTNGAITGSFPSCEKADCSVSKPSCVGGPASIACGSRGTYSCECGKSGSATTRTCSNGVLSGSFPSCRDQDCSVSRPSNVDGPNSIASSGCQTYSCPNCYRGSSTQKCCNNGALTGSFPSCYKADCSVSKPSCVGGPTSIACGSSGTYSCECGKSGYSSTRSCSNGVLSGSFPSCRDRDCSVNRPSGVEGPTTIGAGRCETYRCPNCYRGGTGQVCCNSGTTSGNFPSCSRIVCATSNRRPCVNGPQSLACGTTATFTCGCGSRGTAITKTCQSDGTLTGYGSGFYEGYPNCQTDLTATTCDGQSLYLTCPEGLYLEFRHAYYGRTNTGTCSFGYRTAANCGTQEVTQVFNSRCLKKKTCQVPVNGYTFGNPCPRWQTSKYLYLQYQCRNVFS